LLITEVAGWFDDSGCCNELAAGYANIFRDSPSNIFFAAFVVVCLLAFSALACCYYKIHGKHLILLDFDVVNIFCFDRIDPFFL